MFHFELFLTKALLKRLARVCVKTGKSLASAYIQPLANTTLTFSVEFFLRWQGALTTGKSIAECIGPILFGFLFEVRRDRDPQPG